MTLPELPAEIWAVVLKILATKCGQTELMLNACLTCKSSLNALLPVLMDFIAQNRLYRLFYADGALLRITSAGVRRIPIERCIDLANRGLSYRLSVDLSFLSLQTANPQLAELVSKTTSLLDVHDNSMSREDVESWLHTTKLKAKEIHWTVDVSCWHDFAANLESYTKAIAYAAPDCTQFSLRLNGSPDDPPGNYCHIPRACTAIRLIRFDRYSLALSFIQNNRTVVQIPPFSRSGFTAVACLQSS